MDKTLFLLLMASLATSSKAAIKFKDPQQLSNSTCFPIENTLDSCVVETPRLLTPSIQPNHEFNEIRKFLETLTNNITSQDCKDQWGYFMDGLSNASLWAVQSKEILGVVTVAGILRAFRIGTCLVFQNFPGSNLSLINNTLQTWKSTAKYANSRPRDNPYMAEKLQSSFFRG